MIQIIFFSFNDTFILQMKTNHKKTKIMKDIETLKSFQLNADFSASKDKDVKEIYQVKYSVKTSSF